MSKAIQIRIPEPCQENWQNMTPQEQGRFCGSCQKTVVDFTLMTDKEILAYFSKAAEHTCGRFSSDQLNKDLKPTVIKKRLSWAYAWNIILTTFLITEANAQVKPVKKKSPVVQLPEQLPITMGTYEEVIVAKELKGNVIDSTTNQPLSGVSILIKGTSKGTISDSLGNFTIIINNDDPHELTVSYVGYNTQILHIDSNTNWEGVKLTLSQIILDDIVVGGAVVAHKVPKKKFINDWIPAVFKKDIRIYPNPVEKGDDIRASLSLKQAGEYKLELLNVQGEVMTMQKLVMATKEQAVNVPTQSSWAPGIYWVRISAPGVKNVYQCKVSIQ
ncbi:MULTISPECIES: carboxypeptidase-like regulatory domain-containing protein [Niastella]|uniref:Carboxypeptidase-like regulatory domain-containing protein n=1 Tax=Niastella soli TaxID=2821487 RepID=A0ABS3Z4E2_9BACT|nr:carboxypeptidase-like regulatory domain-containing protein [Niastella soli]MBO9205021.1 carboxypeptidase-like regulatory domain-containing protein [Niastella soli]